ncbi:MAG TPA: hypothetical protein DEP60_06385 [Ruminococcaceae bacterium]|jgi:hypothetical protein|nr:hypothetical protein [Oscillospiraceae bacterium]HCC02313.1 hypothetical protein [Oscillospiraceae bacterium]
MLFRETFFKLHLLKAKISQSFHLSFTKSSNDFKILYINVLYTVFSLKKRERQYSKYSQEFFSTISTVGEILNRKFINISALAGLFIIFLLFLNRASARLQDDKLPMVGFA